MNAKHTPGPWDHVAGRVHAKLQTVTGEWLYPTVALADHSSSNWEDNARLIASAPELLEEAKRNLEWMESVQKHSQFLTSAATVTRAILQKRIDATRAAIAKAEGIANG